jgi:hypothetical protein
MSLIYRYVNNATLYLVHRYVSDMHHMENLLNELTPAGSADT